MVDESDYEQVRRRRFGEIPESPEEREYATRIERKARRSLAARDDDPQITVSTVAEFVFCRRASVLTHEGTRDHSEDELPSLALLPWYERDAIEEKYNLSVYALCAMPVVLMVGAVIVSLFMLSQMFYPVVLGAWLLSWLYVAIRVYFWWRTLGKCRLEAMHAVKCEPDPDQLTFQDVDWWGLLEAGYEVDRPEIIKDGDWKLNGTPRRIIRKGSLSIPVHRINRNHGPLQPQHIIRVTAYCHLIRLWRVQAARLRSSCMAIHTKEQRCPTRRHTGNSFMLARRSENAHTGCDIEAK